MRFDTEGINSIIEEQLRSWPLPAANFSRLREVRRRPVSLGHLCGAVQCNPARIVSTGAKVDSESIKSRPCFLCDNNRPPEQFTLRFDNELLRDWEVLLNPYPILPVHFTIAYGKHTPQSSVPIDIAAIAEEMPGMAIFFNGARAGASAPDHLHMQAVLKCELPLIRLAEESHPADHGGFLTSDELGLETPFKFISGVIANDTPGIRALSALPYLYGADADTGQPDRGLVNIFAWIGKEGILRIAIVPRRRHRPLCYGDSDGAMLVSPGAIDMAGLMICPRNEDFDRIDEATMRRIYADVAYADKLPDHLLFLMQNL